MSGLESYGRQSINEDDIKAVLEALQGDLITRGKQVEAFEREIADYCGARFAIMLNSGSAALQAAYHVANIGSKDHILTTPNTFISTLGAGLQRGAIPHFADLDPTTGNFSLEEVEKKLQFPFEGRWFVVPVHFAGIPVDMAHLQKIIGKKQAVVIEDAAHALGSSYADGNKVGSCCYSDMTIFSLHPLKNITTGEGGLITTNDPDLYHRLQRYRNNGIVRDSTLITSKPWYYEVEELTVNANVTEMQAALGRSQLQRIEHFLDKRRALLQRYLDGFKHTPIHILHSSTHIAYHLAVARIDFAAHGTTRAKVMHALKEQGIGSQVHYIPLYHHPVIQQIVGKLTLPETERYYAEALSLPLHPELSFEEVDQVVEHLKYLTTENKRI